jgi:hypothetical protein
MNINSQLHPTNVETGVETGSTDAMGMVFATKATSFVTFEGPGRVLHFSFVTVAATMYMQSFSPKACRCIYA